MSILMMMVSEQMPTSSDFVPLFGIFYLSIIFIIFIGTLFTAFILNVHLQKMYAKPVSPVVSYIFFGRIAHWLRMRPPTMLLELWNETGVTFGKEIQKNQRDWISMDDMKREAARRNWRRLVKKINSNKQNGMKNNTGGERGQLRQAGRKKVPAAISVPHGEPGPLMLSASAISAFSGTGDSTILESKLKRRYALEWEYLASVLDRVLLIVFSLVVFAVTSIMILVGEAMHLSYELAAKEF
uniref:Neur_chan_memb domain-containing protein n=2 Tax=Caenorhabditis tropicalis TaxID=1561998 RepID=A0A1I7UII5_9PELO